MSDEERGEESNGGCCPILENLKSMPNYDECPVRTIGRCDRWRLGRPPTYDEVNAKYLLQKKMKHTPDSLEKAVENIVKSWEAEIQHKLIPEQIDSIDLERFSMATNNKTPWTIDDVITRGTYCCLLEGVSHPVVEMDFERSNEYFREKFKTGFAWEVVKVFSGPQKVVFSWRHWAHVGSDTLTEEMEGKGNLVELEGFTRANVGPGGKMRDIEVFFDQDKFLTDMAEAEGAG
ncbi:hypothetical protein THAOC_21077 [Thalassiosira oceanica]|uniref:SnoaL-like domain-containing protein n=1 Tax=Thalassiosira oceanica TaxID=159749 RepID=K0S0E6_THAOC|nr:hypothetical protein THAOC_21077 [Thalassiosira oceanica]|mmetsp:Transcript_10016/g.23410  ORF Transcript_10016/g.23410 Transcript_10016/m.23410 type:complete len:233 (+) Transcript_10016:239-937(+)|eukprot:EJK58770.1 hypothetical protein THAOC_21077 [Thalassiosira oceanica]